MQIGLSASYSWLHHRKRGVTVPTGKVSVKGEFTHSAGQGRLAEAAEN
jgi:hypothetical protein